MSEFWTPGNVHNVEYGTLILVFSIIEFRFKLYSRINSRIGDFFGRQLPTAYVLSSPFLIWFWLSLLLFVRFDTNLLDLRAFNFEGNGLGTGHWLTWVVIAAIVTRWGYNNILGGVLIAGLYSALHEAFWYLFYFIVYPEQFATTFPFYLPFVYLGVCLSVSYVILAVKGVVPSLTKQSVVQMLALFITTDSLWVFAGFPVTVSLTTGGTQFFQDLQTNLIEDNSWVTPAIPIILSVPALLKGKKPNKRLNYDGR